MQKVRQILQPPQIQKEAFFPVPADVQSVPKARERPEHSDCWWDRRRDRRVQRPRAQAVCAIKETLQNAKVPKNAQVQVRRHLWLLRGRRKRNTSRYFCPNWYVNRALFSGKKSTLGGEIKNPKIRNPINKKTH